VTNSGQISLPAALRRRWGAKRVLVVDRGDYAIVRPMPEDIVTFLRGSITPGAATLEEIRSQERAEEAQREESR
jgi:bifunctional DNA-binding transcriptional regulator/antitoxin component of YhaV-PrlF toxin-antitoxin module